MYTNYYHGSGSTGLAKIDSFDPINIIPKSKFAVVTLVIGQGAKDVYQYNETSHKNYCVKFGFDYHVIDKGNQSYVLAEKFQLAQYLNFYERILYVDADVLIRPSCPNLFECWTKDELVMHDDFQFLSSTKWLEDEMRDLQVSQGIAPKIVDHCYNTGVVLFSNLHKDIFEYPKQTFPVSHCAEQTWITLNIDKYQMNIIDMPRVLNCQTWINRLGNNTNNFWLQKKHNSYFKRALIMHYSGVSQSIKIKEAYLHSPTDQQKQHKCFCSNLVKGCFCGGK